MGKSFQYLAGAASIVLAYYALKDRGFFKSGQAEIIPPQEYDPVDVWPGLGSGVL